MNNHGWGLREMIFLSAIILFFVILVSLLISNLYSNLAPSTEEKPTTTNTYRQIEKNIKIAAERYYRKYKNEIGNIIFTEDLLKREYIKNLKLQTENDSCEGYVIVDEDFTSYITCNDYETEGY